MRRPFGAGRRSETLRKSLGNGEICPVLARGGKNGRAGRGARPGNVEENVLTERFAVAPRIVSCATMNIGSRYARYRGRSRRQTTPARAGVSLLAQRKRRCARPLREHGSSRPICRRAQCESRPHWANSDGSGAAGHGTHPAPPSIACFHPSALGDAPARRVPGFTETSPLFLVTCRIACAPDDRPHAIARSAADRCRRSGAGPGRQRGSLLMEAPRCSADGTSSRPSS